MLPKRVLAAGVLTQALDPIALARDIEHTLDVLWKLADTRRPDREAARG
ncbi:MAG: hypothetical protein ACREKQ_05945 [Candidatus Rokuibacteriota bacterium]